MRFPLTRSTVCVTFALVVLAGCTSGGDATDAAEPVQSEQPHDVDHEHGHDLTAPIPSDEEAGVVAAAFATAFADTSSGDRAVWLAGLAEHCYSEYCDLLAGADLADIPAGAAPTGPATVASGSGGESTRTATVPAEGGAWTISLFVGTSGAWLVNDCRWSPT